MAVCLGFVVASAYYVCRSAVLTQRSGWQTAVVFGSASLLSGGFWVLLCWGWNALGANLLLEGAMVALPGSVLGTLLLLGSALYLISLLIHDIWLAADQLRAAQAREAQSRLQARDAQLQVLRTQINPHFLFNSLNSISALTSQNAAAARAMTLELAAFFRQTLALAEKDRIVLAQEIALCEHFLAVEKIRFGDKLRTCMEVSEAATQVLVPPMLLQPCLENAVKHGVRHLPEGGCITLRAFVQGPWLYVTMDNPVDPDVLPEAGTGTGLVNIKQRLATVYGEQARMVWSRHAASFVLEIVLPIR
jgi:LytS/YehU family sensor histidine kinase